MSRRNIHLHYSFMGPKTPMFRMRFTTGDELVLTEAGKKKRAGVWLLTPEELERGIITASTGNHGAAVAYAGSIVGVAITAPARPARPAPMMRMSPSVMLIAWFFIRSLTSPAPSVVSP